MPTPPPFSPALPPLLSLPSSYFFLLNREERTRKCRREKRATFFSFTIWVTLEVSQEFREGSVELLKLSVDQLELTLRSVGARALAGGHLQLIHICFLVRK